MRARARFHRPVATLLALAALPVAVTGAPALDLPALECASVAEAYGVPAVRVAGREELHAALAEAIEADGSRLVEVPVAPGMALA